MSSFAALFASVCGFLAVALGAFGAHALAPTFDARAEKIWTLASHYLLLHAAALLGLSALLAAGRPGEGDGLARATLACFAAGLALFSGSLYALALGAPRALGAATPVGGTLLLVGWLLIGLRAWRISP